jgi:hypothetical protein
LFGVCPHYVVFNTFAWEYQGPEFKSQLLQSSYNIGNPDKDHFLFTIYEKNLIGNISATEAFLLYSSTAPPSSPGRASYIISPIRAVTTLNSLGNLVSRLVGDVYGRDINLTLDYHLTCACPCFLVKQRS